MIATGKEMKWLNKEKNIQQHKTEYKTVYGRPSRSNLLINATAGTSYRLAYPRITKTLSHVKIDRITQSSQKQAVANSTRLLWGLHHLLPNRHRLCFHTSNSVKNLKKVNGAVQQKQPGPIFTCNALYSVITCGLSLPHSFKSNIHIYPPNSLCTDLGYMLQNLE